MPDERQKFPELAFPALSPVPTPSPGPDAPTAGDGRWVPHPFCGCGYQERVGTSGPRDREPAVPGCGALWAQKGHRTPAVPAHWAALHLPLLPGLVLVQRHRACPGFWWPWGQEQPSPAGRKECRPGPACSPTEQRHKEVKSQPKVSPAPRNLTLDSVKEPGKTLFKTVAAGERGLDSAETETGGGGDEWSTAGRKKGLTGT